MIWTAAISLVLAAALGFVLTLLTLPGLWLPIVVALGFQWFHPEMFSWWTIGAAVLLGVMAETLEFVASAAGATKAGGTKRSAAGAILGTLAGAIVGSAFFFPIGTILGAVAGAGVGAVLLDKTRVERTWSESTRVGAGAAAARGIAIVIKASFSAIIAMLLVVAALWDRI
ncbi:MAG: DUF456 domain-containing protein [Phycisphaerales bacterium]|nr:DUF456 domain-containing protein [Phycisphaerales bacterium]